jgi:5-methylcytosine-specific restriction endonuclease McrA
MPHGTVLDCARCKAGDHSGHEKDGERRCLNDNAFNSDCQCTLGPVIAALKVRILQPCGGYYCSEEHGHIDCEARTVELPTDDEIFQADPAFDGWWTAFKEAQGIKDDNAIRIFMGARVFARCAWLAATRDKKRAPNCPVCGAAPLTLCAPGCTYAEQMNALAASTLEGLTDEQLRVVTARANEGHVWNSPNERAGGASPVGYPRCIYCGCDTSQAERACVRNPAAEIDVEAWNRKYGKSRDGISLRLRFEILKRDNFTCQYCGRSAPSVALHIDHKKPVSKGGDNRPENLAAACLDCNIGKHDSGL